MNGACPAYRTVIFDCDGVLIDSNEVKGKVFQEISEKYFGPAAGEFMRRYHREHGGISRFRKLATLREQFIPLAPVSDSAILYELSEGLKAEVMKCREAAGLRRVLNWLQGFKIAKYVISGTEERELQEILCGRGLAQFFEGIFGSPRTKPQVVQDLIDRGAIVAPALFIGDSYADLEAAVQCGAEFVFSTEFGSCPDSITDSVLAARGRLAPNLSVALNM